MFKKVPVYDEIDETGEWPQYTIVKRPKLTIAVVVILILIFSLYARESKVGGQITCKDKRFSKEEFQSLLKDYPNLDGNKDGVACE